MTVVIDGKKLAQDIRVEIKAGVDKFRSERKRYRSCRRFGRR